MTGRHEVYVKAFPGPDGRWQVSNDGGGEPLWSPDGREIFYRRVNQLMVAEVSNKGGFQVGTPRVLLDQFVAPLGTRNGVTYAVSPDGKRFLSLRPAKDEKVPTQVNIVPNWAEELRRTVFGTVK